MAGKPGPVALYMAIDPKRYARNAVRVALDNGTLVKGPCKRAGPDCAGQIEAHHDSYAPADWLRVTWMCTHHHELADSHKRRRSVA